MGGEGARVFLMRFSRPSVSSTTVGSGVERVVDGDGDGEALVDSMPASMATVTRNRVSVGD